MPDDISLPTDKSSPNKPWWMPDTQGFLAIAVVASMVAIILILLLKDFKDINDKVFGALLTLSGVVASSYKDVYSFFFGSSKGSADKDSTITKIALAPSPPPAPIAPVAPAMTAGTEDRGLPAPQG